MALPELLINSTVPGERIALAPLKGELTSGGTEFEIEAAELPAGLRLAGQFRVLIDKEIILCEGKAEVTKKVKVITRGAEGSTAVAHGGGASIYQIVTLEGLEQWLLGEPWKLASTLGFKNSWVEYEAGKRLPEYRKDRYGVVWLRGIVKAGTNATAAFQLPAGYRPKDEKVYISNTHSVPGLIEVNVSGEVVISDITAGASKEWTYLDNIIFSTQ